MTNAELSKARVSVNDLKPAALTMDDACRYIGVGKSKLYWLINNGHIKSVVHKTRKDNVQGRRVVLTSSLDAYLEGLGDANGLVSGNLKNL